MIEIKTIIKFNTVMKHFHFDETKFITLVIWGLLTHLSNFTFLCLVVFGRFDTFLDGWWGVG